MNSGPRFNKRVIGPLVALTLATVMTIAGTSARKGASAAVPQATVKASLTTVSSALCRGNITSSTDPADFPSNSDLYLGMGFLKGSPATSPKKKAVPVQGLFGMAINATCKAQNPCTQGGSFTGSIASTGTMTLTFQDSPPPFPAIPDPLDGCQASFQVNPYSKNTQAYFVSLGAIAQNPASGAPHCGAVGTSLVLGCQAINE